MYYAFFGLSQPPFKITPDTDCFFEGGNRGAVLEALIYTITQGEGIIKVTGEVGSGKTMLCRVLQARLPPTVETVYLANPSVSPEEILHAIAFELQVPIARGAGRLEVMHAVNEYLLSRHAQGRQVVVLVEESQSMPIATLEEIRLLSNLETKQHKLLQIVLFGQPELDNNLRRPEIRQLRERITHSFSLPPLSSDEVRAYTAFRLRAAGYHGPDLLGPRVIRYMTRATRGLTRRINIVADKSLLAAFAETTHNVSLRHVRAAVRESEFSNAPGGRPRRRLGVTVAAVSLCGLAAGAGYLTYQRFSTPVQNSPRATSSAALRTLTRPSLAAAQRSTDVGITGSSAAALLVPPQPPLPTAPLASAPGTRVSAAKASPPAPSAHRDEQVHPPVGPSPDSDLLEQRLLTTGRWLEKADGGTYSIQLLGSNQPAMLKNYLDLLGKYIELDQIFVYRTVANRQPSMTVLYGSFRSRAEAMRALEALPGELKANRPYIRTVQGIRGEIGLRKAS